MAIQWFSWRTSGPRCPHRRWRGTCWRWSSSPWPGWGCTRPWCVHAALWSAWRLGRCHLWTRPPHRGFGCARTLHPPSSAGPGRRLQSAPFCQKKKQSTRDREAAWDGRQRGSRESPRNQGAVLRSVWQQRSGKMLTTVSPSSVAFAKNTTLKCSATLKHVHNIYVFFSPVGPLRSPVRKASRSPTSLKCALRNKKGQIHNVI